MAWLPAGPTASEAAEIILLLVVVPFLPSSSLRVVLAALLLSLSLNSAAVMSFSHASTDAQVKDRLRILCDRDTRGTVPSAFHDAGPGVCEDTFATA